MINIKTKKEIEFMRQSGRITREVLKKMAKACRPGVSTNGLDRLAEKIIKKHQAAPSFKGYKGYSFATCISINDEVVHGLPSNRKIKNGDIVGLDVGVCSNGYHSDAAITVSVGKIPALTQKLINVTKKALTTAISMSKPGVHIIEVQKQIQKIIEDAGFGVVRDLCGHGIGKKLQDEPEIANFPRAGLNFVLAEGMTFTYEPMTTLGDWHVKTADDNWTVKSADGSLSCHFEHTILIKKTGAEILT